jgi:hypothetical protein
LPEVSVDPRLLRAVDVYETPTSMARYERTRYSPLPGEGPETP